MGVLEVSRSIGDGPMKSHGVICLPDIRKLSLTPKDLLVFISKGRLISTIFRFVVIACDGLWKVFSPQSAITFVSEKHENLKFDYDYKDRYLLWIKISDDLCAEAVLKGCGDNVSVILVVLSENFKP